MLQSILCFTLPALFGGPDVNVDQKEMPATAWSNALVAVHCDAPNSDPNGGESLPQPKFPLPKFPAGPVIQPKMPPGPMIQPKMPPGPMIQPKFPIGPIIQPKFPPVVIHPPAPKLPYPPVVISPPRIIYVPAPAPIISIPIETTRIVTGNTTAMQITEMAPRGPAARAGLQIGDIILKIDGRRTRTFEDMRIALATSTGKSRVEFYDSDEKKIDVRDVFVIRTQIGVSVKEVPITLDESTSGNTRLEVTAVSRGPAARAGIVPGDIILAVNGSAVPTEADLSAALAAARDECDVQIHMPSEGKTETRRVRVVNGSIGVEVRAVPIRSQ
jgi:membrane-associated protease RseP (regulator of RpoE activity)